MDKYDISNIKERIQYGIYYNKDNNLIVLIYILKE